MPASSDIRNAFNAAADGNATAEKAYHSYRHDHDAETEVLTFDGTFADGAPFTTESPRLRGGSDLIAAAGDAARALIAASVQSAQAAADLKAKQEKATTQ